MGFLFVLTGVLLILFVLIRELWLNRPLETASGSILMGYGIFVFGAMEVFPWLAAYTNFQVYALIIIWILVLVSMIRDLYKGDFYKRHLQDPINRFGIGTWVAGTSVLGNVLVKFMPEWLPVLRVLTVGNTLLWIVYLIICLPAIRILFHKPLKNRVHGVLLLSAVSTQSLVLLFHNVYPGLIPVAFSRLVILFGIVLYAVGFVLISWRFYPLRENELLDGWVPSNCIVHGAMSITGLATVTVSAMSEFWMLAIWCWILVFFVLVEAIEGWRMVLRCKRYGLVKAIGEYHVAQWSRIFTFGMFYAFTASFEFSESGVLSDIRLILLAGLPWATLILLINETLLFLKKTVKGNL